MTILEKIKAKIKNQLFIGRILNSKDFDDGLKWCLELIDKYAEQEPTEPLYRLITDNDNLMLLEDYKTGVRTVIEKRLVPCNDCISRKSIKQKLQEKYDFFVNAYGGFSNLPQNDKSRVDEITDCIAMVVNEPPVAPQQNVRHL